MQAELDMVCVCGSKLPSSRVERIRVRSSRPDCVGVPMHSRKVALEILLGAFYALEILSPCQEWAVGGSSWLRGSECTNNGSSENPLRGDSKWSISKIW